MDEPDATRYSKELESPKSCNNDWEYYRYFMFSKAIFSLAGSLLDYDKTMIENLHLSRKIDNVEIQESQKIFKIQ